MASCWRCSGRRARARPRCCGSSPAWTGRIAGEVSFDGENALAHGASERHVGFVFQHYALFRHMTVFENVAFGLRVQPRAVRKDEAAIRARVKELLDLVQLDWLVQPLSEPAVRRPAPAHRAGPRARDRAAHPAARRAVRRARRQGAQGAAAMAALAASRDPRHLDLRHPRPGRGAGSRQPGGGDGQGPHRADRHARRRLRQSGDRLRARLHRRIHRAAGRGARRLRAARRQGR